ncbi:hypothetical protein K438DRAFT_1748361 [Mycena galopus ATCC 62051]|nr:hypothetical protein K438DRAFT_1748361 [Mycena galopus ATCC 62051]
MPTTPSPSLPIGLRKPSTSAAGLPSQMRNCNGSSRSAQMDKYRAALASLTRQSRCWIRNQPRNANLPKKYVWKTWRRAKFVTGWYTSPAGDGVGEAMESQMTAPKDARIRNAGVGADIPRKSAIFLMAGAGISWILLRSPQAKISQDGFLTGRHSLRPWSN